MLLGVCRSSMGNAMILPTHAAAGTYNGRIYQNDPEVGRRLYANSKASR